MTNPVSVYVYRDDSGTPLYVGQTRNLSRRDSAHRRCSGWYSTSSTVDVLSQHRTRVEALEAERLAIHRLSPMHNMMGNDGHDPKTIGLAFRTMRRAQGLTLRQLAARAGTNFAYLAQFERGEKVPSARWQRAVINALADNLRGVA